MDPEHKLYLRRTLLLRRILLLVLGLGTIGLALAMAQPGVSTAPAAQSLIAATPSPGRYLPVIQNPEDTPTPTPTQAPPFRNGNFEQGSQYWEQHSASGRPLIYHASALPIPPHGGEWMAWFESEGIDTNYYLTQEFYLPVGLNTITFWYYADTPSYYTTIPLWLCPAAHMSIDPTIWQWRKVTRDISACQGQNVELSIGMNTDGYHLDRIFIDDIEFLPGLPDEGEADVGR